MAPKSDPAERSPPATLPPHPLLGTYYATDSASRRARVGALFDSSAPHYDWINGLMSLGSGRWYRRGALKRLGVTQGSDVLDVGCGTGALALAAQELVAGRGWVAAVDPSPGMLAVARGAGVQNTFSGHAEALPFPDARFDFLTMGYALRHVDDLRAAFAEYRRVLKPGGKLMLLEITRPRGRIAHALLGYYLGTVVPGLTRLLRRSADAETLMHYYWDTIEHCVAPEVIVEALTGAGFAEVRRNVVFGTFSEYTAARPAQGPSGNS